MTLLKFAEKDDDDNLPKAVKLPRLPSVDASMDCSAGLMAVIDPDTVVRVNWVKSCCSDDRLVCDDDDAAAEEENDTAAAAVIVVDAALDCNGDIKFGGLLCEYENVFQMSGPLQVELISDNS